MDGWLNVKAILWMAYINENIFLDLKGFLTLIIENVAAVVVALTRSKMN